MRFNSDGKFKIMQITDIQEIPDVSPDTIKLINAALEEEKPDLVVLTGDQIKGYGVSYKGKGDALIESVAETVGKLLKPVTDRHIPFAVTFGNHDRQVGISNKDQFEKIYKASPGCVGEQAEGIDGGGTYNIPILSSDGERTAFNLYLFDSGTDAKGGGYEPFDPQIIDWYRKKRDELKAQNGDYIPSLVFQHIPMFEHYNVLKRVGKREKGAIPAFRIHKGEHYKIDETKCVEGSVLLEPPSIPDINTGEFEALSEKAMCSAYMSATITKIPMSERSAISMSASLSRRVSMSTATENSAACAASSSTKTIRANIRHILKHMSSSATASSIRR